MSASSNIVATIRRTLLGVAKKREVISYCELAAIINKHDKRNWPELDIIWKEETRVGRPDLTLVVVRAGVTDLPGFFNGRRMDAEDWDQKTLNLYYANREELYNYYRETSA